MRFPRQVDSSAWTGRERWFGLAGFAALALVAYAPALNGGLVWDDDGHVTKPALRSLDGLRRIWCEPGATQQYYPVLHTAFWVEHRLWGDAPLGYHLLNVLLHATAAWLFAQCLWVVERPSAGRPAAAWLAALLFLLHPVCVESVAWISEQKNTLSAVFYLLAALVYFQREDRTGYGIATGLFLLATLSKTVAGTLPAALLVVRWWQNGRLDFRRDVRPLLPWLAFAAAAGLTTAWVERHYIGATGAPYVLGLAGRCVLAGRVVGFYLGKLVWPFDLMFVYPRWTIGAGDLASWLPAVALVVLAGGCAVWARRGGRPASRAPLAVLLLFVGTLFPALGFVDVYPFRYSYVADHFQYLASLGPMALAAAGLSALGRRAGAASAPWAGMAAAGLLAALGLLTWRHSRDYAGPDALYRATIARNPSAWLAHNNLANRLFAAGDIAGALDHYEAALRSDSDDPVAYENLGLALAAAGRFTEAEAAFVQSLRRRPERAEVHYDRALALESLGRLEEAAAEDRAAIRFAPNRAEPYNNLGVALARLGRIADAAEAFAQALRLQPDSADAQRNLALARRALSAQGASAGTQP